MHKQSAYAQNRTCGLYALNRIPQQRDTEAAPLPGLIHTEPPQDCHRDRVRHIAFQAAGGFIQRQCA